MSSDDRKRSRALAGAKAAAMSATRFAPLRTVVETAEMPIGDTSYTTSMEVLSCGHHLRPRHDMVGPTYAYRRRCVECLQAACAEAGHPLVDWFAPRNWSGRSYMQCKCQAVNAEHRPSTTSGL